MAQSENGRAKTVRAVRERRAPDAPPTMGRPQEYDERGFPIPQRLPSFAERVRRLLAR